MSETPKSEPTLRWRLHYQSAYTWGTVKAVMHEAADRIDQLERDLAAARAAHEDAYTKWREEKVRAEALSKSLADMQERCAKVCDEHAARENYPSRTHAMLLSAADAIHALQPEREPAVQPKYSHERAVEIADQHGLPKDFPL